MIIFNPSLPGYDLATELLACLPCEPGFVFLEDMAHDFGIPVKYVEKKLVDKWGGNRRFIIRFFADRDHPHTATGKRCVGVGRCGWDAVKSISTNYFEKVYGYGEE